MLRESRLEVSNVVYKMHNFLTQLSAFSKYIVVYFNGCFMHLFLHKSFHTFQESDKTSHCISEWFQRFRNVNGKWIGAIQILIIFRL